MNAPDIHTVLARKPLGLVFDIDGTLSPIALTPGEAYLFPGVQDLLEQLKQKANVAIMTGRALTDGARMVNVEGLTYIGTHGLEWSEGLPTTHTIHIAPEALAYVEPGRYLLDLAERELVPRIPNLIVQRKTIGGSLHYRRAPDPEEARLQILTLLEEPARKVKMRLGEGKRVVEVLSPLKIHKGQALRTYVQRKAVDGIVFAGDDRTDLDAVLEIARLREDGLDGLAIVVQHNDTLPALLEHADIIVHEVAGMASLLKQIVEIV